MTVEKMNQRIEQLQEQRSKLVADMDRKIGDMERERDTAVLEQTQQVFAKHKISMVELYRITAANREQLKNILSYIGEQVGKPKKADNRRKDEKKDNVAVNGIGDGVVNDTVAKNENPGIRS
ncbi:MAG: hypothetical protein K6E85_01410 [Lachnospiraceae bacterium]|nr:hypothetical protein [Lachnospiraceae bacterium]